MIVLWLLDHVPSDDGFVAMIIILLVGDEVGLSQELLLVIFEFSDHCDRFSLIDASNLFFLGHSVAFPKVKSAVAKSECS